MEIPSNIIKIELKHSNLIWVKKFWNYLHCYVPIAKPFKNSIRYLYMCVCWATFISSKCYNRTQMKCITFILFVSYLLNCKTQFGNILISLRTWILFIFWNDMLLPHLKYKLHYVSSMCNMSTVLLFHVGNTTDINCIYVEFCVMSGPGNLLFYCLKGIWMENKLVLLANRYFI